MNTDYYKNAFNQALSQPESLDQKTYQNLISQYPYVRALQDLALEHPHLQGDVSIAQLYRHSLWTAPSNKEEIPVEKPLLIETASELTNTEEDTITGKEDVTVYHDEHMPYSFLWWLNKTRMDFAHTYRPFAPVTDRNQPDHKVLDQQIRENIFHFQEPEAKLSESSIPPGLAFQVPKKSNPAIERFIQEEPKISPPQPDKITLENKARKSASDQHTVVTETLAKIYAEQGLYPKALEVYEKLSLKYPEKSAYFADRIDELKNKLI